MAQRKAVHEMFREAARECGPSVAIESPRRRITYAELEERSNRLAHLLQGQGLAPGDRIAALAADRIEAVNTLLACLKTRTVCVPLDPDLPTGRLAAIAREARPAAYVVEPALLPLLAEVDPAPPRVILCGAASDGGGAAPAGALDLDAAPDLGPCELASEPDDPCYLVFTSGSTGRPKGIAGRLKGIDHFVRWEIETLGLGAGDARQPAHLARPSTPSCATCSPPGASAAPSARPATAGTRPRLRAGSSSGSTGSASSSSTACPRSSARSWRQRSTPGLRPTSRHVLLAGEPLLPSDVRRWTDVFGDRIQLINLYGPTETTMTKFFYRRPAATTGSRRRSPSASRWRARAPWCVDDAGRAGPGRHGGRNLHPHALPHARLLRAARPDGSSLHPEPVHPATRTTWSTGRATWAASWTTATWSSSAAGTSQVKIRGVRVEPAEIESRLLEHPAVADAAVEALEDGDAGLQLAAFVVPRHPVEPEDLRLFLARSLPDSLVPSRIVRLAELPRTSTGKVDRPRLHALRPPEEELAERSYAAPRTPDEEAIAAVWEEVLGLPRIGIHDDLLTLGVHSLTAAELVARVRAAFGVYIPLRDLFEHPTVARLAQRIETARRLRHSAGLPEMAPAAGTGPWPLSVQQERIWDLERAGLGGAVYNHASVLAIRGPFDVGLLAASFALLARRQAALRTRFAGTGGGPVQEIVDDLPVPLASVSFAELPEEERSRAIDRRIAEEVARRLPVTGFPLWRVTLLHRSEQEHVLIVVLHRLVADGGSAGLLNQELAAIYKALAQGRTPALPDLPVRYTDFAVWQRRCLADPVMEAHLGYWRERLAGLRPGPGTSAAGEAADGEAFAAGVLGRTLPEDLYRRLRPFCREQRCTPSMLLLASLAVVLSHHDGGEDVVLGLPAAGRERTETHGLVGCFLNETGFRIDLSGGPSFRDLLARVRAGQLDDAAHQDLPFDRVLAELFPGEALRRHDPLFSVVYNFQVFAAEPIELPDLHLVPLAIDRTITRHDLVIRPLELAASLRLQVVFRRRAFSPESVERLVDCWEEVLRRAMADPDRPVADIVPGREAPWAAERDGEPAAILAVGGPDLSPHGSSSSRAKEERP